MPRKKMPKRPVTKKPKKPVFKSASTVEKPIVKPKPKKKETFGEKVGRKPRREITKRRQREKDLLDDL